MLSRIGSFIGNIISWLERVYKIITGISLLIIVLIVLFFIAVGKNTSGIKDIIDTIKSIFTSPPPPIIINQPPISVTVNPPSITITPPATGGQISAGRPYTEVFEAECEKMSRTVKFASVEQAITYQKECIYRRKTEQGQNGDAK